jgi:hypothetical protein
MYVISNPLVFILQWPNTAACRSHVGNVRFVPIPVPKRKPGRPAKDSRIIGVLDYKRGSVKRGRPRGKSATQQAKKPRVQVACMYWCCFSHVFVFFFA